MVFLAIFCQNTRRPQQRSITRNLHQSRGESNPNGNCFVVLAKGFSVSKFVATLLYDKYSIKAEPQSIDLGGGGTQKVVPRACSPYLIFIINFDEIEYQSLQLNMELLKELDDNIETQSIKLTMLTQKDLLKRNDLYLKGKFLLISSTHFVLQVVFSLSHTNSQCWIYSARKSAHLS